MKQLSQQKWILSSLLIAALGSQYYFSTNSTNNGVYEMSQMADSGAKSAVDLAEALRQAPKLANASNASVTVKSVEGAPAKPAAPASAPQAKLENKAVSAVASVQECVNCTVLNQDLVTKLIAALDEKSKVVKVKPTIDPNETESEKLRREREEREDAKREKEETKKEREREKKLAADERKKARQERIDDRFTSSFERNSSKCSDIKCYSDAFAETLSSYNDKDYNASSTLVAKIFKEKIATDLKERLKDPSDTDAVDALKVIMEKFPKEFSALKKQSVDMAKAVASPLALDTNAKFKQADQLSKQGKIQEATAVRQSAFQQKSELEAVISAHKEAIHNGTYDSKDSVTMSYYKRSYGDPSEKWLQDIMNTNNFNIDGKSTAGTGSNFTNNPSSTSGGSRGVVRGGNDNTFSRAGNNTGSPNVQQGNVLWNQQQQGMQRIQRGSY